MSPPSKNRMPQNLTIAHFGQPVSKCWFRPLPDAAFACDHVMRMVPLIYNVEEVSLPACLVFFLESGLKNLAWAENRVY